MVMLFSLSFPGKTCYNDRDTEEEAANMHRVICSTGALLGMPNGRNF